MYVVQFIHDRGTRTSWQARLSCLVMFQGGEYWILLLIGTKLQKLIFTIIESTWKMFVFI